METYYLYSELAEENRRIDLERVKHYQMIKEAESVKLARPWSKLLVKLAGVLIELGLKMKYYAERDTKQNFPFASMQDMVTK